MPEDREEEGAARPSPAYSNYVLGILFLAYVFNFIDRQIPSILLVPIQDDLDLSDFQMGLLTGPAFALFYATLGVPIARLADVWNRRNIIAIGLVLWSGMTAASGLAKNFVQLGLARIGVGVGEAALSPPAHSLIADYFPPERRATALGIYSTGIHIGILFGVLAGAWLQEFWGWRTAFVVVGLPGIALAVVMMLTVREPAPAAGAGGQESPSIREVVGELWAMRSFRHLSFATGLTAFAGYSFAGWAPAFLVRVHPMPWGELGTKYGLVLGIGGAIGSVLAGVLADRFGRRDVRWWLWVPALATVAPLPFLIGFYTIESTDLALTALFPGLLLAAMYQGPVFSTVQTLARPRMRAVASGVLLFVINIIGLGLGPPTVGLLNDTVFASEGDAAVRSSLLVVGVVMGGWSFAHFLLGARTLRADLRRAGS